MKRRGLYLCLLLVLCLVGIGFWRVTRVRATSEAAAGNHLAAWQPAAAETYLNSREVWWQNWPPAQVDHGTLCISCHTVVPYAMVQPALRRQLNEPEMAAPEKAMLESVETRVGHWTEMIPFYSDQAYGAGKTAQSHATEAVLNAVILASYDTAQGHLRPITRTAFNEAWALQESSGDDAGGWLWQDFHLAPWESGESAYQGAALLAVALGNTPDQYTAEPGVRDHVDQLQQYLRRKYAAQPLMSQLYVLWASAKMPGLMTDAERTSLMERVKGLQQADGGWTLSSLDEQAGWKHHVLEEWKRLDGSAQSDGCATGLAVLAMEESGIGDGDPTLKRGLAWLAQHQEKDGKWLAASLNASRDPNSDVGRFMSDAATGYAVLALEIARQDSHAAAVSQNAAPAGVR